MRIQEMRSGLTHLRRKAEARRPLNIFERGLGPQEIGGFDSAPVSEISCELYEPRWAVASFDQIEAGGMTYSQAALLLSDLDAHGLTGLCIVTDEAAARIRH